MYSLPSKPSSSIGPSSGSNSGSSSGVCGIAQYEAPVDKSTGTCYWYYYYKY